MTRRRTIGLSLGAAALIVVAAAAWRTAPLFIGPSLPPGATRLAIATDRPNLNLGCPAALLAPARVSTSGDALVLVTVDSGEIVNVVWPSGFGAWRRGGRAVVADPWGAIVGMDGDILSGLGGGLGADDLFHICPFGIPTRVGTLRDPEGWTGGAIPRRAAARSKIVTRIRPTWSATRITTLRQPPGDTRAR